MKIKFGPQLLIFLGSIISVIGGYVASSNEAKFELDIKAKNEQIANLNSELVSHVTGGNSFCYIFPVLNQNGEDSSLIIFNAGNYPMYDITVGVQDLQNPKMNFRSEIGNLSPGVHKKFAPIIFQHQTRQGYDIYISARNGHLIEFIRLRRVGSRWSKALKIFKHDPGKQEEILHQAIDLDFPLNPSGRVDW